MTGIMPPSLDAIIKTAAAFEDGVFSSLNELIQKPTSTDPTDADLKELSSSSGVAEDDLRYFLSLLAFLFTQTSDIRKEELKPTLEHFVSENGVGDDADKASRLAEKLVVLLEHRSIQSAAAKKARLREGFLPNIINLANFVDRRSDFQRDETGTLTGEIGEAVSIVQLAISTNSIKPHEKEIILQLDERSLSKLEDTLKEIREKLAILSRAR